MPEVSALLGVPQSGGQRLQGAQRVLLLQLGDQPVLQQHPPVEILIVFLLKFDISSTLSYANAVNLSF